MSPLPDPLQDNDLLNEDDVFATVPVLAKIDMGPTLKPRGNGFEVLVPC